MENLKFKKERGRYKSERRGGGENDNKDYETEYVREKFRRRI